MKKTKVLVLVVACALMLSGVGYALWSDNITIKSSAQTGNLQVEILDNGYGAYPLTTMPGLTTFIPVWWDNVPDQETYMDLSNVSLSSSDNKGNDTIEVHVSNLYPQAKYAVFFKIKNTGDFPVKLKSVAFNPALGVSGSDLYNSLEGKITLKQYRIDTAGMFPTLINTISTGANYIDFADLGAALVNAASQADLVLMPGDEVWSFYDNTDPEADADVAANTMVVGVKDLNGDQFEDSDSGVFTLTFDWEQCDVTTY